MEEAISRSARLQEFFRRLHAAAACSTFDEAYSLFCATLDQVEDELSGLPNEPKRWMTSDRMFPPQLDRMSSVAGCEVKRFDDRRHVTYIAENGSMEIRSRRRKKGTIEVHFSKTGADGRSVGDVCPLLAKENR